MTQAKVVSWEEWAKWVNKQLEGHQREISYLKHEVEQLKVRLNPLHAEHVATRILKALREEGRPRSWRWIHHRFGPATHDALKHLMIQGLVTGAKSGSHTMYVAKEG